VEGSRVEGSVGSVAVDGTYGSSLTAVGTVGTVAGLAEIRLRICLETCSVEDAAEVAVVVVEGIDTHGKRDQKKTCIRRTRR